MAVPIGMPKLGMTMREGRVVEWPVAPGGRVEKGRPVVVIESEKAEVEIEATATGVLRHVYVPEGETVPCGTLLAAITESADEAFDAAAFQRASRSRSDSPAFSRSAPGAEASARSASARATSSSCTEAFAQRFHSVSARSSCNLG